jgi:molybdate transport system regulatory protein
MAARSPDPASPAARARLPSARRSPASARFRLRVTAGEVGFVGPGKVALLEAIRDTRSITAAAKSLGMSYRRAWMLVDEMNRAFAEAAVATAAGGERGGGSALTPLGAELVDVYRRIEATAEHACARDLARLLELAAPRASAARRRSRSTP